MSVSVITWAWKQKLPTGPKFVLIALADNANNDGLCYPGQDSIAEKCGMTDRTVRNAIKSLTDGGFVTKLHRQKQSGRGRTSDLYQLMIPGAKPLHQPENISALSGGDQAENSSCMTGENKPENISGKESTNRKNFPDQAENSSGSSNKVFEPSVEPSEADHGARETEDLSSLLGKHWQHHQILHAKTLPMVRRWEREGVSASMVSDAIEIATARLGQLPGHPSYLANIVDELRVEPKQGVSLQRRHGVNRQQALEDNNRSAVQRAAEKRRQQAAQDGVIRDGGVGDA